MPFIKLTQPGNEPVYVNTDCIKKFSPKSTKTRDIGETVIYFGDHWLTVMETPKEIMEKIVEKIKEEHN